MAFANPSWLRSKLTLMNLLRGQRFILADLISINSYFTIELAVETPTLSVTLKPIFISNNSSNVPNGRNLND